MLQGGFCCWAPSCHLHCTWVVIRVPCQSLVDLIVNRPYRRPETGLWSTAFEYCQGVCRTTARSTQHENAFILDRRFCFSKQGGHAVGAWAGGSVCSARGAAWGGAGWWIAGSRGVVRAVQS